MKMKICGVITTPKGYKKVGISNAALRLENSKITSNNNLVLKKKCEAIKAYAEPRMAGISHAAEKSEIFKKRFFGRSTDKLVTKLTIQGDTPYINEKMLRRYEKLDTLIIEDGVESINTHAFENLSNLRSLTIPPSLTKLVDENAERIDPYNLNDKRYKSLRNLLDKEKITKLTLSEGFSELNNISFESFGLLSGWAGILAIPRKTSLFENFPHVEELVLPSSIKEIKKDSGLSSFENLKSLTVHKGTEIEKGAIPKGVEVNYI